MRPFVFHSEIFDSEEWEDEFRFRILFFLIGKAKQRDSSYKGVPVKRGQVKVGRGYLALGTGIPKQVIRTRLKWMEMSGTISIKVHETSSGERFSIITIINYERFQKYPQAPVPRKKTTAKKINHDYTEEFEAWWSVYKKGSKLNAFQAWERQKDADDNFPALSKLIKITEQYRDYCISTDRPMMDGQGWLNQRYYEGDWTHEGQNTTPTETEEKNEPTFRGQVL